MKPPKELKVGWQSSFPHTEVEDCSDPSYSKVALLFKDRACKKSIKLFSIIINHVNMFEHSGIECFQNNCALGLTA